MVRKVTHELIKKKSCSLNTFSKGFSGPINICSINTFSKDSSGPINICSINTFSKDSSGPINTSRNRLAFNFFQRTGIQYLLVCRPVLWLLW